MIDLDGLPSVVAVAAMELKHDRYATESCRLEAKRRLEGAVAMCVAGEWEHAEVLTAIGYGFLEAGDRFEHEASVVRW